VNLIDPKNRRKPEGPQIVIFGLTVPDNQNSEKKKKREKRKRNKKLEK
jgi:hypothetical protein